MMYNIIGILLIFCAGFLLHKEANKSILPENEPMTDKEVIKVGILAFSIVLLSFVGGVLIII